MKEKDLRSSILQLAVEGRLVPQDATEEPAGELMARIRDERRRLVAAGRAKAPRGGESVIYRGEDGSWYERRGRGEPGCIDKEVPFDIPGSWQWTRIETIGEYQNGFAFKPEDRSQSGTRIVRIQNLTDSNAPYNLTMKKPDEQFVIDDGDVLVSWSATLRAFIWNCGRAYLNQHIFKANLYGDINRIYYCLFMNLVLPDMADKTHGSTLHHLTKGVFGSIMMPLPPIVEQRRIVAKVDELMPLVEEYGRLEEERERLDSELPGRLRKSVLQLAVEGRLVAQDATEEPACELMARIRDERRRLVAAGRAKAPKGGESVIYRGEDGSWYERRGKGEPRRIDGEVPFDIPESWEWARLSTIAAILNGDRGKNYPAKSKGRLSSQVQHLPVDLVGRPEPPAPSWACR